MTSAIIVAAGKGTRMGPRQDKLFIQIAGRPLVSHTWERFDSSDVIDEVVLVVREGMQEHFLEAASSFTARKPYRLVAGGAERQDSVWNGLEAVHQEASFVVIHDGARPCASHELILATVLAAREHGAAVAAQRVTDTIKQSDDGTTIACTVDRSKLWAVQTPQTFRLDVIRRAIRAASEKGLFLTDDTAACELISQPVHLVETKTLNPKATSPADLPLISFLLSRG
jgi:2-C-methyl-D-erythritol 4-phosphate cytidylyltransferase